MRSFFLTLFSLICFSLTAQVDQYQKDIVNYLNSNGTKEQYSNAYDEMFGILAQQFMSANVPETKWKELKENKTESLDELVNFLSFAYRKHFTHDEIKQMYAFYKTPEAQQMLKDMNTLSASDSEKIAAFFTSDLGKKIEAKRIDLSADISEISGHWSRELFAAKMSDLVKNGYVPQQ